MAILPVFGGPLKRDIVQMAFEELGQAGYEFELSPEEYDSGVRRLNAMLAEWKATYGIDMGYNFPAYGNGSVEEESGIPNEDLGIVSSYLARRIAPSIGKAMGAEANAALAMSFMALRTRYNTIPTVVLGRQTIRGAGNRGCWPMTPFFPVGGPPVAPVLPPAPTPSPAPTPTPTPTPFTPSLRFNDARNDMYLGAL